MLRLLDAFYEKICVCFCLHIVIDKRRHFFEYFIFQLLLYLALTALDLELGLCGSLIDHQLCVGRLSLDARLRLADGFRLMVLKHFF